jgi:hypothetical protein
MPVFTSVFYWVCITTDPCVHLSFLLGLYYDWSLCSPQFSVGFVLRVIQTKQKTEVNKGISLNTNPIENRGEHRHQSYYKANRKPRWTQASVFYWVCITTDACVLLLNLLLCRSLCFLLLFFSFVCFFSHFLFMNIRGKKLNWLLH